MTMDTGNQEPKHNGRNSFPRNVPFTKIVWPSVRNTGDKIQQVKSQASPQATGRTTPSVAPSIPRVPGRGVPPPVKNVRVRYENVSTNVHTAANTITAAGSESTVLTNQKKVTVMFHLNPNQYHQKVNVYLKQGNAEPTLVASGATGPLTFTTNKTSLPSSIMVQREGNWGATHLAHCPSAPLKLRD